MLFYVGNGPWVEGNLVLIHYPVDHPMSDAIPSLSTDQLLALVELERHGSIRLAAERLFITEQGLRSRLLTLEQRVGAELYRKRRGPRRGSLLTEHGRRLVPQALAFLEHAKELCRASAVPAVQEVHIAASQYLTYYVLIDAVKRFHRASPLIRIRLSTRTEQEVESSLLHDSGIALGFAAPYEPSPELDYLDLFSMDWSFIAPPQSPLLKKPRLRLQDLADDPLILFERGSTGRQHIMDAFRREGVAPRIEMEATSTQIIVRMVEAGLGVSIVPLLKTGAVTKGQRVGTKILGKQISPIRSGVLSRRGETLSAAAQQFIEFVQKDRSIR
jgi:DNA-binding transcriptional LysR family regulator